MANFGALGAKYYRSSPDGKSFKIIRIIKSKRSGELTARNEDNTTFKTTLEKLKEEGYRRLKPNGLLCFTGVKVGTEPGTNYAVDDVVVSLFRQEDLEVNKGVPYAVCRQNINDIFYQYMSGANDQMVGLSCTQDSFPEMEKIDFSAMLLCEQVYDKMVTNVYVYIQDTLDTILDMVKVSIYDKILSGLREDYIKTTKELCQLQNKTIPMAIQFDPISKPPIMGYCNTLRELLEINNFMYDFDSTFGIIPVNFILRYDEESGVLDVEQIYILEVMVKKNICSTLVLKYDHDVNLKSIKLNYQLIRDATKNVFVVAYVETGEYIESDPEIVKIKNDMSKYLAYSTKKY